MKKEYVVGMVLVNKQGLIGQNVLPGAKGVIVFYDKLSCQLHIIWEKYIKEAFYFERQIVSKHDKDYWDISKNNDLSCSMKQYLRQNYPKTAEALDL